MQDYSTNVDRLAEIAGTDVYDQSGDKIGTVAEIFYDDETRAPQWIGVGTGFFGMKRVLVPVQGASISAEAVTVPYDKDLVKDSPDVDGDRIDESTEHDLYAHYGLAMAADDTTTRGSGDDRDQEGVADIEGQTVTRSEEELRVGKRETEAGRVRLRKWVETEPVEETVDLRRETVRVTREPLDAGAGADAEIGEGEVEVTVYEERPVVSKEVVARERVTIEKDVDTVRETVSDEVRRERVEIDGDVDDEPRR